MPAGELASRWAVAVVGIPVVLALLWVGGWPLGIVLAGVAAVTAGEFYALAFQRGARPYATSGAVGAAAFPLLAARAPELATFAPLGLGLVLFLTLFLLVVSVWLRWPGAEPMNAVAVTVMGVVYTGGCLSFAVLLRHLPDTLTSPPSAVPWHLRAFVLLPLAVTWLNDTAAYFAGRAWGRRKLAPWASPGKTVEGALAGLLVSVLTAAVLSWLSLAQFTDLRVPVAVAAAMGLFLGAAAQVGDLVESVLKREAGVKDSGHLLAGHGGMLDRIDALLFSFPATYALLLAFGVV